MHMARDALVRPRPTFSAEWNMLTFTLEVNSVQGCTMYTEAISKTCMCTVGSNSYFDIDVVSREVTAASLSAVSKIIIKVCAVPVSSSPLP